MMKYQTNIILSAGDVSTNLTSSVVDLRFNYGWFLQAKFTGAPTGSVLIEGTNDDPTSSSAVWSTLDTLTVSGTTTLFSNKDGQYAPYIRARKASGGTGTMTVTITIKGA